MINYKCSRCGTKLESDDDVGGKKDKCPACGAICDVPMTRAQKKGRRQRERQHAPAVTTEADVPPEVNLTQLPLWRRRWFLPAAAGVLLVLIGLPLLLQAIGRSRAGSSSPITPDGRRPQETPKQHIPDVPPKVEYLEEKELGSGYYAWIQIEPLARPELEKLGQRLLSRMRRFRCDHLKVWVCYTRRDYAVRSSAVWMNAVGPEYKLSMVGAVPESTTPQGLLEAYVKWHPMMSLKSGKGAIRCEYKPEDDSLICHDYLTGAFHNPLHMPAVILQMGHAYLPPDISHPCWAAIPGLKRVVVHYYQQEDDPNPVVTLSFGRHAFENAKRLAKPLYKKESELDDMLYEALKRHHAKAMSDQEYRASCDQVSRQIYKLYEDLWVEVSPGVRIEVHRKMPPAPQDFYRKYFCGGK